MTDRQNSDDMHDMTGAPMGDERPGMTEYGSEPGYDDGLGHDHGWACRERGAPAY